MKPIQIAAYTSLLAVAGGTQGAQAAISTDQARASLQEAICTQDWNRAVAMSSRLIAAYEITPEHRQNLVDWRHRFSNYALDGTRFSQIPNCVGTVPTAAARPVARVSPAPSTQSPQTSLPLSPTPAVRPSPTPVASTQITNEVNEQVKASLQDAICTQDWNRAVILSTRLITSAATPPDQRQTLVDWRHRFFNYAADQTRFAQIPNCGS